MWQTRKSTIMCAHTASYFEVCFTSIDVGSIQHLSPSHPTCSSKHRSVTLHPMMRRRTLQFQAQNERIWRDDPWRPSSDDGSYVQMVNLFPLKLELNEAQRINVFRFNFLAKVRVSYLNVLVNVLSENSHCRANLICMTPPRNQLLTLEGFLHSNRIQSQTIRARKKIAACGEYNLINYQELEPRACRGRGKVLRE